MVLFGYILPALAFASGAWSQATTTVSVSSTASHAIPTLLWGQMFEDINHSGDGGLYAELLQNRAFQQVQPNTSAALVGWSPVNGSFINVVADTSPLSAALPNSLALTIPVDAQGDVGFSNEGFWGSSSS
jgi:alpha-N-arabinofuranosidase